jgi:uncharacterized protein YndB with AHSA1/START domain
MNASAAAPSLTVRREVAATPAELFDAWLDADKLAAWMRPGDARKSDVEIDPRVGGEFEVVMHTAKGDVPHTGAYQLIDRPRRIVFTWNSPNAGSQGSYVTIDFRPAGRGTEVVLTHARLPSAEEAAGHTQGWDRILGFMADTYAKGPSIA